MTNEDGALLLAVLLGAREGHLDLCPEIPFLQGALLERLSDDVDRRDNFFNENLQD